MWTTRPWAVTTLAVFLSLQCFPIQLSNGLCNLENSTAIARCHDLQDVKYIDTYGLETLKTSFADKRLKSGFFTRLKSLKSLDLSDGELKHIEPGSFAKLSKLQTLSLADNNIENLELGTFAGLRNLQSLDLRRNQISQLPPVLITLKNLRNLEISGNPLDCNCATMRVRDLLQEAGVKMSKRSFCASPPKLKSAAFLKQDTHAICTLEEQDNEMQGDQPAVEPEGSGDQGSGDVLDQLSKEFEEDDEEEGFDELLETPAPSTSTLAPVPETAATTSDATIATSAAAPSSTTTNDQIPTKTAVDDEIFFESEEANPSTPVQSSPTTTTTTTTATIPKTKSQSPGGFRDELIVPIEGSGDGGRTWFGVDEDADLDSGSGSGSSPFNEGSGSFDWAVEPESGAGDKTTTSTSLLDLLFGALWSTAAPNIEEGKDLDLAEEEFIHVTPEKELGTTKATTPIESVTQLTPATTKPTKAAFTPIIVDSSTRRANLVESPHGTDQIDVRIGNEEMTDVAPSHQPKKGMGSYVVLGALLAIVAGLIGFAAYKGDFCRKKRKRNDPENGGTEMKDMRTALLDGNGTMPPKIAANGNPESAPLVKSNLDKERESEEPVMRHPKNADVDSGDPVKPPRKSLSAQREEPAVNLADVAANGGSLDEKRASSPYLSASDIGSVSPVTPVHSSNDPPLTPGAHRVKIVLQENPDSVPKTPILITRTKAGENLVMAP
ncbi:uncharacterized protein LOC105702520 [Orussus abietinus]|uniref:uncharacterized protein LOC105702520 n=1 Tax=Orussus abietinus TaxID=222816 RepID=UPI0006250AA2|nr:uncharacterized protein LOC105702520 [Orussus abietinus]XP_012285578.1 uncharacterized protein LOC105702520 [Orussus abietinus]